MMNHLWYFGVALALVPMMFRPAGAQQGPATVAPGTPASGKPAGPETLETINSDFERGVAELERRRLESLARLAAGQGKDEASKTYDAYFRLVITDGPSREAEPAARRAMQSAGTSPEGAAAAVLAHIIAETGQGAY